MLEAILQHLNNWFLIPDGIHAGVYTVEGGAITLPFLQNGQYFRITGSLFNDGVYQYGGANEFADETFQGAIWALAIPQSVITLAEEVADWQKQNGVTGPYTSESFGGYSYTKAVNPQTGQPAAWQDVFRGRLNVWRKLGNLEAVQPTRQNLPSYTPPYDPDHPWR